MLVKYDLVQLGNHPQLPGSIPLKILLLHSLYLQESFSAQKLKFLDVLFDGGIKNPKDIEMSINNIPGVLENGLFVDLTDKVLVGKIENNTPVVYSPQKLG